MFVAFHVPYFGSSTVEVRLMECPHCARGPHFGVNDWKDRDISTCEPGDVFECNRCGSKVEINWGLSEPDHLSHFISSEHCPHRLCKLKYAELCQEKGWAPPATPPMASSA